MNTAGIDGCPLGWLAIDFDRNTPYWIIEDQHQLQDTFEAYTRIFIDIPIGVPEESYTRTCDEQLRKELGSEYSGSVFDPPIRSALYAPTYAEACMQSYSITDKKVSLQSWNIADKIKQVDQILRESPDLKEKVHESHPELLYKILNGWEPIKQKKQTRKGLKHRLNLMKQVEEEAESIYRSLKEEYRRKEIGEDDIMDAMVLAHFARISEDNEIETLPEDPETDAEGLPMYVSYVPARK